MQDKYIVDRMQACFKKAEEILHIDTSNGTERVFPQSIGAVVVREAHFTYEVTDLALALFNAGYRGVRLDLDADINTLRDPKHGYVRAGNPDFMGLFGRDSIITSWQLLDYDPMIARQTLLQLAHLQGKERNKNTGEESGKILHEYYPDDTTDEKWFGSHKSKVEWLHIGTPVYFSVDSTPLFIILYDLYCRKTFDGKIREKLEGAVKRARLWISCDGIIDGHGFVGYETDKDVPQLENQSWKDSEEYHIKQPVMPVEVQGYAYAAASPSNDVIKVGLKKEFNKKFWMTKQNYPAFALDGDGKQVEDVTSNPGHLLFTGILDEGGERLVVKKLFSDELWTPYGIRTLSMMSESFDPFSYHSGSVWPHDNWIIAQGLKKCGYHHEYKLIKGALFRAYDEIGYLPEYYGVFRGRIVKLPAQYPQAWSSGALLSFLMEEKNEGVL